MNDFLSLLAAHYDELRAFVRAFLRERRASTDFLRRAARGLQEGYARAGAVDFAAWARRRLAAALRNPSAPLRRSDALAAVAAAFGRRRDPRPERGALLDLAIQGLSQDAQPALTARYENDLPVETVAWRFRTTPENALAALGRIRRLLLKALHGVPPAPTPHELIEAYLERTATREEVEELAARLTRDPAVADAFADACRLDADLSAYFTLDADAPDEGASLAVKLADRPRRLTPRAY